MEMNEICVRCEVFTAVPMKNAVFWDIESGSYLKETHYVSAKEPSRLMLCKIEVFTVVNMKNVVF
jgi:hypothetical protein